MVKKDTVRLSRYLAWVLVLVTGLTVWGQAPKRDGYAVIDSRGLDAIEISELKADTRLVWWLELSDSLLVRAERSDLNDLERRWPLTRWRQPVGDDALVITGQPVPTRWSGFRVLAADSRFAVIDSRFRDASATTERPAIGCHADHDTVFPFQPNTSLAYRPETAWWNQLSEKVDEIDDFVAQADVVRWYNDVVYLSCINRYSRGETISDATYWLQDKLRQLPGLQVSLQRFSTPGFPADNVIAVLPGTETPDDWYVIGAHYDSISQSPTTAAPGAEDNGSGTAAVLEMARLFADHPPKATLVFILFSAEEQGLHGSRYYVDRLVEDNHAVKILGMLNMDMISFSADEQLDILLETNAESEYLTDPFIRAAQTYTDLRVSVSLNPFGSDHVPFLVNDIPALLVIDTDYSIYPGYHRTNDTAEKIVLEMGWDVLRMNLAAIAEMAGIPGVAPTPPTNN